MDLKDLVSSRYRGHRTSGDLGELPCLNAPITRQKDESTMLRHFLQRKIGSRKLLIGKSASEHPMATPP